MQNTMHWFCSICYPCPDKILSKHSMHEVAESQKLFRKRGIAKIWKKIHELANGMFYFVPSLEKRSCQVLEQKQLQALQLCGLKNFYR